MKRRTPIPARRPRRLLRAALLLGLLGGPMTTSAAESGASAHIAEANALARSGRYADALAIYQRVLVTTGESGDLSDRAGLLGNVGHCLDKLGRPREAIKAFEAAGAVARDDTTRALLAKLVDRIERGQLGRLTVECDAGPAAVTVPDRPVEGCPATITRLRPGSMRVSATTADGAYTEAEVRIRAGRSTHVELGFPGRLLIDGAPDAQVHIDGEPRCTTPCEATVAASVEHLLTVEADGQRWQEHVTIEPAARARIEPRFEDDTWLWVGVGVGAAVVAGTAIGLALSDTADPAPRVRLSTLRPE